MNSIMRRILIKPVKTIILIIILPAFFSAAYPQVNRIWNNKICAVSLTYDDALNVHLDNVIPVLDSLGFNATFYITGNFPGFKQRIAEWKSAAEKGNELGNHTLFHPCAGSKPGREWVSSDYDLDNYSIQRLIDEIELTNILLSALDNKSERTFAYPCGDKKIGDSSYVPKIKNSFVGSRSVEERMQRIDEIDLYNIGSYIISGHSGDQLINLVKEAMVKNTLLVFLFHGVGGEHSIDVSLDAHNKLLNFLKQNENEIWIAPLADITDHINNYRKK